VQINKLLPSNFTSIIFDLGQVIIDVDQNKTCSEIQALCQSSLSPVSKIWGQDYFLFELGKISAEIFFIRIRKALALEHIELSIIEKAWNSMIRTISCEKIALLRALASNYRLFALSNTNSSHVEEINRLLVQQHQIKNMDELFEKVYYSHELGLDKPDKKIFQYVINDAELLPQTTIFIDDNYQNIIASSELGFKTIHLTEPNNLWQELESIGIDL